ncbi:hypothetical protein K7432_007991 [Basidiobolus ranarum]|uniref:Uncharacterized protein n=1 Tax=Basidiobolus ranarum TaxID=34480 RepID=A0ABR2VZS4_9FUNG
MSPNVHMINKANSTPGESDKDFSNKVKVPSALGRSLTKTSVHTGTPDEDLTSLLRKTMRMSTLLDKTNKPERVFSYHEYNDKVRRENLYKQAVGSENFLTLDNSNRTSKLISDFTLAKINEKPVPPQTDVDLELGNVDVEVRTSKWYKSRRFFYALLVILALCIMIVPVVLLA